MHNYINIGKLVAVFGLKGELLLKHALGKKTGLKGLAAIFIEHKKESFLPWFIVAAIAKNETEVLLQLEGITSREAAIKLLQKEVWIPEADFQKFVSKKLPINLLGYSIIHESEDLGKILELVEQPHQLLCRIEINNKEVLIPLHEETLLKINHSKKEVHVTLPDGLLNIYLD